MRAMRRHKALRFGPAILEQKDVADIDHGHREIVKFHFGESMFAATAAVNRKRSARRRWIRSGISGVPLRMISPGLEVTLIESNAKKAAFLSEIVRKLDLNIEVFKGRTEEFPESDPHFDFVTSRAVGHLGILIAWSERHFGARGSAIFWATAEPGISTQINRRPSWIWSASDQNSRFK